LRAEQGNPAQITKTLAAVARVAIMRGEAERAARLWDAVAVIRATQGIPAPADADGDEERRTEALIRETLETRGMVRSRADNGAETLAGAIRLARDILGVVAGPRAQ
jgi:hypothetical protein